VGYGLSTLRLIEGEVIGVEFVGKILHCDERLGFDKVARDSFELVVFGP